MSSPRFPNIRVLTPELGGWGFFLCTQKDVRQGRGGELFISLSLQDRTGLVRARIFNEAARLREEFDSGDFVKVQGRTELFNGRMQLRHRAISAASTPIRTGGQGFREEDCVLVRAASGRGDVERARGADPARPRSVRARAAAAHHRPQHAEKLRIWPAALTVHHAYRGGFLEHILSVARSALTLGAAYGANQDLLTAGALLHDIGKLEELEYDRSTSYTREGNLVGHVTLGAMMVRATMAAIPDFPDVLRTQIEHLIVSHHGHKEFGAPVEPMTIEAMILSAADDLDAKINQVRQALAEDGEGEFTAYHSRLGRVLWRG